VTFYSGKWQNMEPFSSNRKRQRKKILSEVEFPHTYPEIQAETQLCVERKGCKAWEDENLCGRMLQGSRGLR
jgi:hypothetical protein